MKQIPKNVKNIIFDLGGVLLDIDAERSINAFKKLGMDDLILPGGWDYRHEVFLEMEHGKMSENQFYEGIRSLLPNHTSDEEIDQAWCAMLVDFEPGKIELLRNLREEYQLYLFSNTNSIHIRHFHHLFRKKFGHSISDLFVKDYYSSEMQLRKPSLESFQYVLEDAKINPEETLFIDDSKANVESARQAAMQAIWLSPEVELNQLF